MSRAREGCSGSLGYLSAARARAGLTQRELGLRVGVSQQLVTKWERGVRMPRPPHLRRLGRLLGVPVDVLRRRLTSALRGDTREWECHSVAAPREFWELLNVVALQHHEDPGSFLVDIATDWITVTEDK